MITETRNMVSVFALGNMAKSIREALQDAQLEDASDLGTGSHS